MRRFGRSDEISDAMRARTLALPYHMGTGIGSDHSPVTLDATTACAFDISAAQVLSIDSAASTGDIVYASGSAPDYAFLNIGASGTYLRSDGASPGWSTIPVGDVAPHDLLSGTHADTVAGSPTRGALVYGDSSASWNRLAHPGGAGYALTTNTADVLWDQTPVWTGSHTWDDGAGDSPALVLVGGSNDDTARIFLDDDAVAGDSDLVVRLCAADTGSRLQIQDNSPAVVAYIDADGNADFAGHVAAGGGAAVSAADVLAVRETSTATSGTFRGVYTTVDFDPGGNFSTDVRGLQAEVLVGAAATRTDGTIEGFRARVVVDGGVDARSMICYGGSFTMDIEDAGSGGGTGATTAYSLSSTTPAVDTGHITDGGGLRVAQAAVGAGQIDTLSGIYVGNISNGVVNYAVQTNAGNVVLNEGGDASTDFRVESDTKTHMLFVDAGFESVLVNSSADLSSTFGVVCTAAADIGSVVRGADSQSAHLVVYQDSNGDNFFESSTGLAGSTTTWNQQGVDIDFYIEAAGVADAFFLQGSDGQITLGALGAGVVQSDASGVLSSGTIAVSDISDLAYDTPALTFSTANAAGSADTVMRTDATLAIFDATTPAQLTPDIAAATGSAGVAARRDHVHNVPAAAPAANLSVSTTNAEGTGSSFARNDHSHAITTSSNPGAAAGILATDASGYAQLLGLGIGAAAGASNRITVVDGGTIGQAAGPLLTFDDTNDYLEITGCSVGIGTATPGGLVHASKTGDPTAILENTGDTTSARGVSLQFHHSNNEGARINAVRDSGDADGMYLRFYTESVGGALAERMRITDGGIVVVGTTAPSSKMTTAGLTLDQVAGDGSILSLQSSDISHPFTDLEDADTYGAVQKPNATYGGVMLRGFREDSSGAANYGALHTQAFLGEDADTGHTTGDHGITRISSAITDGGTGYANINADGHILTVENNNSTRFIFSEDGDMNYDGAAPANYDGEDDALALWDLSHVLAGEWEKIVQYSGEKLERMGVITVDRSGNAEPGHEVFVSLKSLNMLLMGAAGQLHRRVHRLERALIDLGADPALLK